jgi:hypothetical protein
MRKRAMKLGDVTAEQDLTVQENIIAINCQISESVSIGLTTASASFPWLSLRKAALSIVINIEDANSKTIKMACLIIIEFVPKCEIRRGTKYLG